MKFKQIVSKDAYGTVWRKFHDKDKELSIYEQLEQFIISYIGEEVRIKYADDGGVCFHSTRNSGYPFIWLRFESYEEEYRFLEYFGLKMDIRPYAHNFGQSSLEFKNKSHFELYGIDE